MALPKPDKTTTKNPQKSATKSATSTASKQADHLNPSNLKSSHLNASNTVAVDARALNQQEFHDLITDAI